MFEQNPELLKLAERAEEKASGVFRRLEARAFQNQMKILEAFRARRVSTESFAATTGYGYDDAGREKLDQIFADVFEAEAAFVRHNIVSGTHGITIALFGLLRPGDTMLAVTGTPYDTLQSVIGITGEKGSGSLADFGVRYEEVALTPDSRPDIEKILQKLSPDVKMV